MADRFYWNDELVTVKLLWSIQLSFLPIIANGERQRHAVHQCQQRYFRSSPRPVSHVRQQVSPLFSPQATPNSKWRLQLYENETAVTIFAWHLNSETEKEDNFVEPALVEMSMLTKKGTKVFRLMLPSQPTSCNVGGFILPKKDIIQSKCLQSDGTVTFYCKILISHAVKNEPISSSAVVPVSAIDADGGLSSHLEKLFSNMSLSDVIFTIDGREFPAHKNILAARSDVFAAMFQHPIHQIEIEDIKPEVFQEMLRFIYTGRVSTPTMETMSADLLIAADKYLLDALKLKCENYLLHHMSPDYCLVLLLHGDLQNPTKPLKEAATFFRRFASQVTATERWAKMEEVNPRLLCQVSKFVLCKK